MATLDALIEALGPGMIDIVAAPAGLDREVARVVVHDPVDRPDLGSGDLVLAPGLASQRELTALLEVIGAASGAALFVKGYPHRPPGTLPEAAAAGREDSIAAADASGVALLSIPRGTPWVQLVLLIQSFLASDSFGGRGDETSGVPTGDLFAVANAICDLVDAPVTIEDPQSRVLAFSSRQEEADPARMASIMGRQVPGEYTKMLRQRGFFQKLLQEREPVYIDGLSPDVMPREAIAVRAGDEVLGSIWAAVKEPLSPDKERAFIEAAGAVALHMLRHRVVNDVQGGLHVDLVSAVLHGGGLGRVSAERLDLRAGGFRVIAAGLGNDQPDEVELEVPLIRLRDLLGLHLSATHRGVQAAIIGSLAYVIVPNLATAEAGLAALRDVLERFVSRAEGALRRNVLVGIGSHAVTVAEIPRSRADADQVMRVLRRGSAERRLAEIGQVRSSALLMQFADEHGNDPALTGGPLQALRDYDERHHSAYVETLTAYLEAFGDVERAARQLNVHANTIRYRIRQLPNISEIDISEPAERLALMLQLQLIRG